AAGRRVVSAADLRAATDLSTAGAISSSRTRTQRLSGEHAVLGEPGLPGRHAAAAQSGLSWCAVAALSADLSAGVAVSRADLSDRAPLRAVAAIFHAAAVFARVAGRTGLADATRGRSWRGRRRGRLPGAAADLWRAAHDSVASVPAREGLSRVSVAGERGRAAALSAGAALSRQQRDRAAVAVAQSRALVGRDDRLGDAGRDACLSDRVRARSLDRGRGAAGGAE